MEPSYYERNRELYKARAAAYYKANRDRCRDYHAKYFQDVTLPKRRLNKMLKGCNPPRNPLVIKPPPAPKIKGEKTVRQPVQWVEPPPPPPRAIVQALPGIILDWNNL